MLDERDDAALVLELVALAVALIVQRDEDAAVEERELAQTLRQRVEAVFDRFEDLVSGLNVTLRPARCVVPVRPGRSSVPALVVCW
jgi:hypothetical protein